MNLPFSPYLVPTADFLSLSFPSDSVHPILDGLLPLVSVVPGVAAYSKRDGWVFPGGGLIQVLSRFSVGVLTISGGALTALRAASVFGECLRLFGSEPHRVTRLDATLDILVPASPLLHSLYRRAVCREFSLTRKSLLPSQIIKHFSPGLDGVDTGTLYLGHRTAEVRAVFYDKQFERISKGYPDPGSCLRAELVVTDKVGVSLKDAWEPAPVFWHYMSSALTGILERPVGVPRWAPGGEGFTLPPRAPGDPTAVLRGRLERSRELRDMCGLACSVRGGAILFYRFLDRLGLPSPFLVGFIPGFLIPAINDDVAF